MTDMQQGGEQAGQGPRNARGASDINLSEVRGAAIPEGGEFEIVSKGETQEGQDDVIFVPLPGDGSLPIQRNGDRMGVYVKRVQQPKEEEKTPETAPAEVTPEGETPLGLIKGIVSDIIRVPRVFVARQVDNMFNLVARDPKKEVTTGEAVRDFIVRALPYVGRAKEYADQRREYQHLKQQYEKTDDAHFKTKMEETKKAAFLNVAVWLPADAVTLGLSRSIIFAVINLCKTHFAAGVLKKAAEVPGFKHFNVLDAFATRALKEPAINGAMETMLSLSEQEVEELSKPQQQEGNGGAKDPKAKK